MCAIILRKKSTHQGAFFRGFNWVFDKITHSYKDIVGALIRKWKVIVVVFMLLVGLTYAMFTIVPTAFIPDEDQGYFYIIGQGPPGMSLQRTQKVSNQIEKMMMNTDGVADVMTIGGYNLLNQALDSSATTLIVILKPWDERKTPDLAVSHIINMTNWKLQQFKELQAFSFNPPPIQGLSQTGGFQFELQDMGSGDIEAFSKVAQRMIETGAHYPALTPLSTTFKADYPQYYVDLDRTKAKTLGISISTIFSTLQSYLGALYVNDFNKFGRIYRVFIQAKGEYRSKISDLSQLYVRSQDGDLIPLSTLVKIKRILGPQTINHYNIYRSIEINGSNSAGHSSGEAIKAMENISQKVLPHGYAYEWTEQHFRKSCQAVRLHSYLLLHLPSSSSFWLRNMKVGHYPSSL